MAKTKKSPVFLKPPSLNSLVTNSQRSINISLPSAKEVVSFLIQKTDTNEIAIHFVGKQKIAQLHAQYFHDPTPTDCITFPYEDPNFLGEVYVCPKVAEEYVKSHGGDVGEEITLYIVHGFLHLLGYEDTTPQSMKEMRTQEKKRLSTLAKNKLGVKIS
ncbi:MAG: Endoribonuclease YbeY [Chlamydiae bacterium]|nr:Endoribonuclease YbeY [Chlamydiota bacterium]